MSQYMEIPREYQLNHNPLSQFTSFPHLNENGWIWANKFAFSFKLVIPLIMKQTKKYLLLQIQEVKQWIGNNMMKPMGTK